MIAFCLQNGDLLKHLKYIIGAQRGIFKVSLTFLSNCTWPIIDEMVMKNETL